MKWEQKVPYASLDSRASIDEEGWLVLLKWRELRKLEVLEREVVSVGSVHNVDQSLVSFAPCGVFRLRHQAHLCQPEIAVSSVV